jgi:ADP-heptose:LPS heptosyltransferase
MKALVICTAGGIGDVLLATPLMRALRDRYDEVVALTSPAHRSVLSAQTMLSDLWIDDRGFTAQAGRIAAAHFDAAVVTWASLRSAALPFVGRVPVRVGQTRRAYSPLFTVRVPVRSEFGDRMTHWTQILLDYARAIDCDAKDATPSFPLTQADRDHARQLLGESGIAQPYVVLHPTRGIAAAHARWPSNGLIELGRALRAQTGCALVVTGTRSDGDVAEAVAREAGGISLAGKTSLAAFGAVAESARAVVAMDSGPMHVAAAVGAPTVGLFPLQSDEPDRWAPLGRRTAVVRATYPCPPAHRKETCPDFACVAALDVPAIISALGGLLETADEQA